MNDCNNLSSYNATVLLLRRTNGQQQRKITKTVVGLHTDSVFLLITFDMLPFLFSWLDAVALRLFTVRSISIVAEKYEPTTEVKIFAPFECFF